MSLQTDQSTITKTGSNTGTEATASVVVVGGGPVGMCLATLLSQKGTAVTVLSDETVEPYNRVRLTPLLSGDAQFGEITLGTSDHPSELFNLQLGQRVVRLDTSAKTVITGDGGAWPYDTLVLATGSRAFVPGIPGKDLSGVYRFRSADDASALLARSFSARKVAVIGGGLLGLEAAKGMRQRGCQVTVLEHESHLMPRQLDKAAGALLAQNIEELGVAVRPGVAVKEIIGTDRVTGLTLSDGTEIECDTVVICTGVRANTDLAQETGIAFNRGIIVNDMMQTSDPDIFAIGECAEHAGQMYGLVGPGFAQADVAAAIISGESSSFSGFDMATKLKVIGAEVFSAGPVEQQAASAIVKSHKWQEGGSYRRIFVERGKLVGALAVGKWEEASRIQDAISQGVVIYPWMLLRFRKSGLLWPIDEDSADAMPDAATLCNCTGVTCGQVRGAITNGCATVDEISAATGASTVCGTCKPLVEELLDTKGKPEPIPLWKPVLGFSAIALLGALYPFVVGNVPLPESYTSDSLRDWLWRDNIVKQWSGFILLGLTLAAFVLGLRKRIRFMDRLGSFDGWRVVHNGIGIAALVGFFAHTGFSLGSGWNMALAIVFIAAILIGGIAGLATGGDHELRARRIGSAKKPPRKMPTWVHILLLWPLPALLLFHVLASYAF